MDEKAYQALSDYFKLITHPVRLQVLEILREGPACVCHINAILDLRQSYLSQQLAVLREGGLIIDEKVGWNVYYEVADPTIYQIIDLAWRVIDPDGKLQQEPLAIDPNDCSCPRCQTVVEKRQSETA
jgi:DNA-binding transcriptional ArsR family regulator